MAKYIFQYFLFGVLCIALVLASGPTPVLSFCFNNNPWYCDNPDFCKSMCHGLLFTKGVCDGHICCCQYG
ncbi:hypothetical protein MtrunA17_Chr3g0098081 [Medicago truncatula]|uniref:LCR-like protein n=1 Tax=Medicago truncatula TaxID=3880 RepID=G7J1B8_MEDTR|nr:LCR-like protein [Medicago truncatula]RHN67015.1 hypothetical protein MtrunA17_Chr3g0098081 [Medicago truncatula]